MSSTFETVAGIISETADIPREQITPESHAIDDLGIDSLAFLDIAFAIDKAFGIKLPLEQWTQEVNEGKAPAEEYFVLKNLVRAYRRPGGGQEGLTQQVGLAQIRPDIDDRRFVPARPAPSGPVRGGDRRQITGDPHPAPDSPGTT